MTQQVIVEHQSQSLDNNRLPLQRFFITRLSLEKIPLKQQQKNGNKMRSITKYLLLSLVLSSCASATPDEGIEPTTYPLDIGNIVDIKITKSGLTSPASDSSENDCSTFILTQEEVNSFFKNTMMVHESDYRHMLDWSPCYIEGNLTLSDGNMAIWAIHRLKAGSIVLSSGKTVYLYCPKCSGKAFKTP